LTIAITTIIMIIAITIIIVMLLLFDYIILYIFYTKMFSLLGLLSLSLYVYIYTYTHSFFPSIRLPSSIRVGNSSEQDSMGAFPRQYISLFPKSWGFLGCNMSTSHGW